MPDDNLEEKIYGKINDYVAEIHPSKDAGRNDLEETVKNAWSDAVKGFLVNKHGDTGDGITPKKFYLGARDEQNNYVPGSIRNDAEKLFREIGKSLLPHMFGYDPDSKEAEDLLKAFDARPEYYEAMVEKALKIRKDDFLRAAEKSKGMILNSDEFNALQNRAGYMVSNYKLRHMQDELYKPEHMDIIKRYLRKKLPEGKEVDFDDPYFMDQADSLIRTVHEDPTRRHALISDKYK